MNDLQEMRGERIRREYRSDTWRQKKAMNDLPDVNLFLDHERDRSDSRKQSINDLQREKATVVVLGRTCTYCTYLVYIALESCIPGLLSSIVKPPCTGTYSLPAPRTQYTTTATYIIPWYVVSIQTVGSSILCRHNSPRQKNTDSTTT